MGTGHSTDGTRVRSRTTSVGTTHATPSTVPSHSAAPTNTTPFNASAAPAQSTGTQTTDHTSNTQSDSCTGSGDRSGLSVLLEFASSAPSKLLRQGSSVSTFSQLHTTTATSTSSTGGCSTPVVTPNKLTRTLSSSNHNYPPVSPAALSHAIQTLMPSGHPLTPQTPTLLTQDAAEQKAILLSSLFQAIDRDSNGYVAREELLSWVSHEPWLRQESLTKLAQSMLDVVQHDEDSRCSKTEFLASFDQFSTSDVITLVVNLLRAGMVARIPKLCFVYNSHDPYLNGLIESSPEVSPDPQHHPELSVSDTPAQTMLLPGAQAAEASRHFFLLDVLFASMDRDLDGFLDVKDLSRWLRADPWIHEPENADLFVAVDNLWRELEARNAAAGFVPPPEALNTTMVGSTSSTASTSASGGNASVGPARLEKFFFFLMFSQVPKKSIRKLLVHLLSRNASNVMDDAAQQREADKKSLEAKALAETVAAGATGSGRPEVALVTLQPPSLTTALPAFPYPLVRKHSVVTSGSRRISVQDGLRVTLVGQAMIQHDLRESKLGEQTLKEMFPLLQADVVFTELETSLVRPGSQPEHTRNTVFFHAAEPTVVDCLEQMGFNMIATANNHSGDLGSEGLQTIMDEFSQRKLCMAGIGKNASHAAKPAFLNTPNGRIAQICFASKIPEHSIALENRPGVNSLSMIDQDAHTLNPVELNRILGAIEDAREGYIDPVTHEQVDKADMIIAYHHNHYWERGQAVNQEGIFHHWKRELAHRMIDAGAHVYVAHGDPRLQGIEIYRGSPILYCLGNFIFQTKTALSFYGEEVWQSVIVHLHCNDISEATSYSVKLIPVVLNEKGETEENHLQTRGLPRLASRIVGQQILSKLQKLSAQFGTTITIEETVENDPNSPVIGWVMGQTTSKLTTAEDGLAAADQDLSQLARTPASILSPTQVAGPVRIDDAIHPPGSTRHRERRLSSTAAQLAWPKEEAKSSPIDVDTAKLPVLDRELSPQAAIFPEGEMDEPMLLALKASN